MVAGKGIVEVLKSYRLVHYWLLIISTQAGPERLARRGAASSCSASQLSSFLAFSIVSFHCTVQRISNCDCL